jgi:hypothetical protein
VDSRLLHDARCRMHDTRYMIHDAGLLEGTEGKRALNWRLLRGPSTQLRTPRNDPGAENMIYKVGTEEESYRL